MKIELNMLEERTRRVLVQDNIHVEMNTAYESSNRQRQNYYESKNTPTLPITSAHQGFSIYSRQMN